MILIKKTAILLGLLLACCCANAQFKVRFIINRLPPYHKTGGGIYLVGSFNRWHPGDPGKKLQPAQGKFGILIELPAGLYEFKFTWGSWETVEAGPGGKPLQNRKIQVQSDTSLHIDIEQWADHFPKKPKETTANRNVHIVDTAFFMPELNRYRRVWIYLPPSYTSTRKKYPVLYMHDGQNVFDEATSFSGEWGVDESLDSLGAHHGEMIVVAVDNGGDKRINEYNPYDMEKYGKGEGDAYVDFLVNTLRPYINKHYRTKTSSKHTFIAGSSMGGLITFYALLKYPKRFGGAGVFSPAFWLAPPFKNIDPKKLKKVKGKIYFFAGQQESQSMVPDMLKVFEQVRLHAKARLQSVIRAEGTHSEATWRHEFPQFYQWLMEGER